MVESLTYLTYLAGIFLGGVLISLICHKIRLPNVFFLILFGMVLSNISYNGKPLVNFPISFIATIALFALILIIFDGGSKLKLKEVDDFSLAALKLYFMFAIIIVIFLTPLTMMFFGVINIYLAIIFSIVMGATAAEIVFVLFKTGVKNDPIRILEIESLVNDVFVILFPIMILNFLANTEVSFTLIEQLKLFGQQIITGIGAGIIVYLILFKIMRVHLVDEYTKGLSKLTLLMSALVTYVVAELLKGNGILAVTTLALLFGNSSLKQKAEIEEISSIFSNALEILIFVLIGLVIHLPLSLGFIITSLFLYLVYTFLRYLSVHLAFKKKYNIKEKLFMTLVMPKGISATTLVLVIATYNIPGIEPILNLFLIFTLYSIIVGTVAVKMSKYFFNETGYVNK